MPASHVVDNDQGTLAPYQPNSIAPFLSDLLTYQPDLAVYFMNDDKHFDMDGLTTSQVHRLADATSWISDPKQSIHFTKKCWIQLMMLINWMLVHLHINTLSRYCSFIPTDLRHWPFKWMNLIK